MAWLCGWRAWQKESRQARIAPDLPAMRASFRTHRYGPKTTGTKPASQTVVPLEALPAAG
jgi:hypothetical protein